MSWRDVLGTPAETRKSHPSSHGHNSQNGHNASSGHCGHIGHAISGCVSPPEPDTAPSPDPDMELDPGPNPSPWPEDPKDPTFEWGPDDPELPPGGDGEPELDLHGFTLGDLEAEAHPDEWAEIQHTPEALEAFALALLESRQIDAGVVPDRFTQLARCQGCGAVLVPPTWPTRRVETLLGRDAMEVWHEAEGCPWCRLRLAGEPYPKAAPVDREGNQWPRPITWQGRQ